MRDLASSILEIIGDYHNDNGFQFTEDHILEWVNQFNPDHQQFILGELLHLLRNGIYISKHQAKALLLQRINQLSRDLHYSSPLKMLADTVFLDLQEENKSQKDLLALMEEVLQANFRIGLKQCGTANRKVFIYLDDVLATGSTITRDLIEWLKGEEKPRESRLSLVNDKKIILIVSLFCCHNWGWSNAKWQFKLILENDDIHKNIMMKCDCDIENNIKFNNPKLNLIYPTEPQSQKIKTYLEKVKENGSTYFDRAYRKVNVPNPETFFSNSRNRIRFENILLEEGINIIERVRNLKHSGIRPLGYTVKNHQTFGLGTLFFTWRNIPNNCPLVFWWCNPAHNWTGLFPVKNRGN